jgi:hypothetical protein
VYNNRMNYNVIEKTLYYGGKMRRSAVNTVNDGDPILCTIVYRVTANLQGRENCTANKLVANTLHNAAYAELISSNETTCA